MLQKLSLTGLLVLAMIFITGCASSGDYNEFTNTINFTGLEEFEIKEIQVTGNDVKSANAEELKTVSERTLESELKARGFTEASADADFYWVLRWNKQATFRPNITDSINGPQLQKAKADDPGGNFGRRWHLSLEAYTAGDDVLFWRKELPNLFEAIELTEWRIEASVERGIKNFPKRVATDPNLPSLE